MEFCTSLYQFKFSDTIKYHTYQCADYKAITFYLEEGDFDVVDNKWLGHRLNINLKDGSFKDIPFKKATFGFLPDKIEVIEL